MKLFNHFDILAPIYDRVGKSATSQRLIELCQFPVAGRLLDIAGGTGRKSYNLIGQATDIVIADSSHGMLEQAKNKGSLITIEAQAEELPFRRESFARIIMVDAYHHLADHRKTVAELWRVLQPQGIIVIEEPDIQTALVKMIALIEKLALMRSHFVSPQEIKESFIFPGAVSDIVLERNIAWIVIKKIT